MRIVDGEGADSVVDGHTTPLPIDAAGRQFTAMTEATIANSDRPGFSVARWMIPLLRTGIRRKARKLWADDHAYAERHYDLRQPGGFPG